MSVQQICIGSCQGAGQKACGVNHGTLAKKHSRRIDQKYLPIALQGAKNLGHIATGNTVKHLAGCILLNKLRGLPNINIELLPIQNGTRRIGNLHQVANGLRGGLPSNHRHPGGVCIS